ncbi:MAG: alpha/beta hydrolase [Gemmatimonadales bacterium]|nr:MAG: alpha/beta hydrolase [Gemmatimonadales bacterium]
MGDGTAGWPRLRRYPKLRSDTLHNYRDILVATPPRYDTSHERYPVVYMQDGQNLFDPGTSHAGDWSLLETLARLASDGIEAIVVGIANTGTFRRYEYSPFRDDQHGGGDGGLYLDFLVETVKPLVDGSFRTRPDPASTVTAGSSLGGLVSLYSLLHRPDVFGAAGALSPSAWFADEAILDFLAEDRSPTGRLYLDVGTGEDQRLVESVRRLRTRLEQLGWSSETGFRYVEVTDAVHHESAWGLRLGRALPFLLSLDEDGIESVESA